MKSKQNKDKNIVLLDDNLVIRYVLRHFIQLLQKHLGVNFRFYSSQDGVEGLGYIFVTNPDIIIIDATLPKYSGKELVEFLATNSSYKSKQKKIIVIYEKKTNLKLPSSYVLINKQDPKFLTKLLETVSKYLLDSNPFVNTEDFKNRFTLFGKATIAWANKSDLIMNRVDRGFALFKPFYFATWVAAQFVTSLNLSIIRLFARPIDDNNIEQINNDVKAFRARYYLSIASMLSVMLIIGLTMITYLSGFALLISRQSESTFAASWYNSSWLYRKKITIDAANVDGASAHTNFPVMVSLVDSDLSSKAKTDGFDILFTSSDGTTKLDHEIETYTTGSGTLLAWVRVPTLSHSTNTELYMYYGNSGAANQQNASGVWDSTFRGVYHMNDSGTFSVDSKGGRHLTTANASSVAGRFGNGRQTASGYLYNDAHYPADTDTELTFTMWFNPTTTINSGTGTRTLIDFMSAPTPPTYRGVRIRYNQTAGYLALLPRQQNGTFPSATQFQTSFTAGTWHSLTFTVSNSEGLAKIFLNGTEVSSVASANYLDPTDTRLMIGALTTAAERTNGIYDEVRVAGVRRSDGWISTEYNNYNTPSTFYSVSSEETPGSTTVAALGSQTASMTVPSTNQYVGGAFAISADSSVNVTGITIREQGTVNAQSDLENVKLFYELDVSDPYNCSSESFAGTETQFGTTTSFNGANGTASFTGSVGITATSTMCVYAVLDVKSTANNNDTLLIDIANASTDVSVSSGTVSPASAVSISGTTNLLVPSANTVVSTRDSQVTSISIPSTTEDMGGMFVIKSNSGSRNVTGITISEQGTVNAQTGLENVKLWYDLDTSSTERDCTGYSRNGNENQFGSTTSFNAANGTASFTGTVGISTTTTMCVYVELDVTSSAADGETIELQITDPSADITVSSGGVDPSTAVAMSGTTTLVDNTANVTVSASGFQTSSVNSPSLNQYVGGKFVLSSGISTNVTGITIREQGTVNAQYGLDDVKLFYDLDTSAPYDCESESYSGGESQFGTTETAGFNGANGTATFTGNVAISTTAAMCVYVVFDVTSLAGGNIEIDIADASTAVTISSGTVGPASAVAISGTTSIATSALGWYNNDWNFRKKITFNGDDLYGSSIHKDFPMLVNLSSDSSLQANALSSGNDILFTAKDGKTKLDHEIERYNSGTGELQAWVRIPALETASNQDIYMYYGNSGASNQQNVTGTWQANYRAVHHLQESPSSGGSFLDSTSNTNNATFSDSNANTNTNASTKIDGGVTWAGDGDFANMGQPSSLNFTPNSQAFTISAWINIANGNTGTIVGKADGTTGNRQYQLYVNSNILQAQVGGTFGDSATGVANGTWRHVAMVNYNDSGTYRFRFYVDGNAVGSPVASGSVTNAYDILIGARRNSGNTGSTFSFNGSMDEVKIAADAKSADWIKTEYHNQNTPGTFYTVDTQESNSSVGVTVGSTGSQTGTIYIPSADAYVGGAFTIAADGATNITSITVREQGSVDGATDISNIKLFYDLDSSNPYDCASESYAGTETQFGSTATGGFNAADGSATFTGSVGISATSTMCVYVVLDVNSSAETGETLEIDIANASTDVSASVGIVSPSSSVAISGTTTLSYASVSSFGAQSENLIIDTADQHIGGGFAITTDAATNLTSVTIREQGTINAQTSLANVRLLYDLDETDPYNCISESFSGGEQQFGSNTTFDATNGVATFTDSIGISATSTICLYVVLDVNSSAGVGETILIDIENPSTDVELANGEARPDTTVGISGTSTIAAAAPDLVVDTIGSQATSVNSPTNNFYVGGAFTINTTGSTDIEQITIREQGTVDAAQGLNNVRLFYELDVSDPYNCSSETYSGAESQFGSSTVFNGANGTATFTDSVGITETVTLCLYVVTDVTSIAAEGQTIEIDIANPSTDITASTGEISPGTAVGISGTTTVQDPGVGWYNEDWNYRKKITIDSDNVFGSTSHMDFPALVSLATDADLQTKALSTGNDILFTDKDGTTKLNHEIETYVDSTGSLIAWVKIPALSPSVDTDIYMYYGNGAATNQQNVAGTWRSEYKAVQHLQESPSSGGSFLDSTVNANDAEFTDANANSNTAATTKINGGLTLAGDGDFANLLQPTELNFTPDADDFTISAWINVSGGNTGTIISKGDATTGNRQYHFLVSSNILEAYVGGTYADSGTTVANGTWRHVSLVNYDDAGTQKFRFYVDGEPVGTPVNSGANTNAYDVLIGARRGTGNTGAGYSLNGSVDEVKIAAMAKTADWIKTEYFNQNTPATFYSVDTEEAGPTPDAVSDLGATAGNSQVSLTWTAPADNGSAIIDYIVEYKLNAEGTWNTFSDGVSSSTGTTVTGLTNGQLYDFRVAAENSNGVGPYSNVAQATPTGGPSANWYNVDWFYRKKITVDSDQVFGSTDLVNFPIVIDLSTDAQLAAKAQSNGNDILFTSADGSTKLDHQIQEYTSGSGKLIAWVKVPELKTAVDTELYMYYGNGAASNQQNVSGTWSQNFEAVWHMNNDPSGSAPQLIDSAKTFNGTSNGSMGSGQLLTGKIGQSINLDGSNDFFSFGSSFSAISGGTSGEYTFSMWLNPTSTTGSRRLFGGAGINFGLTPSHYIYVVASGTFSTSLTTEYIIPSSQWTYVTFRQNSSGVDLYINGELDSQLTTNTASQSTGVMRIGSTLGTSEFYEGQIDHSRVADVARTADWIKTEYSNQNAPGTFSSLGSEEVGTDWFNESWGFRKRIIIDSDDVYGSTPHTNFPFLIGLNSDSDLAAEAKSNGDDILFTLDDGITKLNHEIEYFNSTTGKLDAWVQIPSLATNVDTEIYMYYGNAAASNQQSVNATWRSEYKLVQHLQEAPANSSAGFIDSTSNANNGTPFNFNGTAGSRTDATGLIDGAIESDGSNDYITIPNDTELNGYSAITAQFWFNASAFPSTFGCNNGGAVACFKFLLAKSNWASQREWRFRYESNPGNLKFQIGSNGTNLTEVSVPVSALSTSTWHFVTGTWDTATSTMRIYLDGDEYTTNTFSASTLHPGTAPISISSSGDNGAGNNQDNFLGIVDNVRVLNTELSADWIKTEYFNQLNPGSTFSISGPDENLGGPEVTNVTVNEGEDIALNENSTTAVNWTATITDLDGYADISAVQGKLYRSGVVGAQECTVNNANCYQDASCNLSACAGTSCTATCSANVQFFADPTDTGSTYASESWIGWVQATDAAANVETGFSPADTVDVLSLIALSIDSSINFGTLTAQQDSGSTNQTTIVRNVGNIPIDGDIAGTNLCKDYPTCSTGTLIVSNIEYALNAFTYGAGTALSSSQTTINLDLAQPTATPSNSTQTIYWGVSVPIATPSGVYEGEFTITGKADE